MVIPDKSIKFQPTYIYTYARRMYSSVHSLKTLSGSLSSPWTVPQSNLVKAIME